MNGYTHDAEIALCKAAVTGDVPAIKANIGQVSPPGLHRACQLAGIFRRADVLQELYQGGAQDCRNSALAAAIVGGDVECIRLAFTHCDDQSLNGDIFNDIVLPMGRTSALAILLSLESRLIDVPPMMTTYRQDCRLPERMKNDAVYLLLKDISDRLREGKDITRSALILIDYCLRTNAAVEVQYMDALLYCESISQVVGKTLEALRDAVRPH